MSTLAYLDEEGTVTSFHLVPWFRLNEWLSEINGNPHETGVLAKGVNRGKVLEELEARRQGQDSMILGSTLKMFNMDRGYGKDWREKENKQGYTHLEELLVYQPKDWRKQAREYLFRFDVDLCRESSNEKRTIVAEIKNTKIELALKSPILVVLFHPDLKRTHRYEPLNFLLAYGAQDPLPALLASLSDQNQKEIMAELSPLDFFLEFENYVASYEISLLRRFGKLAKFPRLCLIKELDFSDIIGQRLAKQLIRQAIVNHVSSRIDMKSSIVKNEHPLSMIFAGPSGNGKTEIAKWLAKLMNKPGDEHFIKVDCGKLSNANEIFGMAGAYQGAETGSALNNFVTRMSMDPDAIGIVLLDEIEKADKSVIHGLYQVIDKGEWTNKRLGGSKGSQTDTILCNNLVFIMTTNLCDEDIAEFSVRNREVYTAVGEELDDMGSDLCLRLRRVLQSSYPFTQAFMGRIDRVVPFLSMAPGDPDVDPLILGEMMAVAKLLIERQQEKFAAGVTAEIHQVVTAKAKHSMAKIIVQNTVPEAGVRAIQKGVESKMGDRMLHSLLLERGGIQEGSQVRYYAKEDERKIDFRVVDIHDVKKEEEDCKLLDYDEDTFG